MRAPRESVRKRIQRTCNGCGGGGCTGCAGAQRSPRGEAPEAVPQAAYEALRQPGEPLDDTVRKEHESALGYDLSSIRVHDDPVAGSAASEMNAHAFTFGQHIVLADDVPPLSIAGGRDLLRHELTHAIEQQPRWDPRSEGVGMLSMQATDSADERDAAAAGAYQAASDELDSEQAEAESDVTDNGDIEGGLEDAAPPAAQDKAAASALADGQPVEAVDDAAAAAEQSPTAPEPAPAVSVGAPTDAATSSGANRQVTP